MSTRTRSFSAAIAHQLRQYAVRRIRGHERDLQPVQPPPWLMVDQLDPALVQLGQLRPEVVDLVGDVVHPGPAPREKAADRRVLLRRGQKLDPPVADPQRRRLDTLLRDGVPMLE